MDTCSAPGWCVGTRSWTGSHFATDSSLPTGYCALSVFRVPYRDSKTRWGDHNGRVFDSREAYQTFALEHGYTQRFYRVEYAVARRVHRKWFAEQHRVMLRFLRGEMLRTDLVHGANQVKAEVTTKLGSPLAGTHWAVGFWNAARNLRPDLFEDSTISERVRATL